ncbi:MAG: monoamine oxidase [Chthoniobacter sp.]|jgi:monoamine oxidase|nr:monoamine oxidase [Chthoniobacter sp.]
MPRTPLAQRLSEICSLTARSHATNRPLADLLGERELRSPAPGINRRQFLADSARAALVLAGAAPLLRLAPARAAGGGPRIVIIGAGLAGLTCAFRLKQAGYTATIFEAANQLGGRCQTKRGFFLENQIAERGGELIDTGHRALRLLAKELELKLDDLLEAEAPRTAPFYFFDGAPYSLAQATADFQGIYPALQRDVKAAGYPTLYHSSTARGRQLDQMSIVDWIKENVPGGVQSRLGQLIDVAYNIEYGAESTVQSSLNMLYLLGYSAKRQLEIFGESDERYHIRGGNDQLVTGLAAQLGNRIETGTALTAIVRRADGSFRLTLARSGGGTRTETADKLILALPFSILRSSVDLSQAGLSALKRIAIAELGMGTNSKMQLQFTRRHWSTLGCNGDTFADTGYQNTWEASRAQAGQSGILVDYTGGNIGASFSVGTPGQRAQQFLNQIEPVLPGLSSQWNGKVLLDYWTGNPFSKGSYSYWKVGQYTRFAGIEGAQEGNCHFCGEHTSIDFQGYLNGAIDTGERAADEIVSDLTGHASLRRFTPARV